MTTVYKFWLVWNPSGGAPNVTHLNESDATTEAKRLAEKFPGKKFVVLESTHHLCTESPTAILVHHWRDPALIKHNPVKTNH